MTEATALSALLVAEHQVVWAYGAVGARLDETQRVAARAAYDAHRRLRAQLVTRLEARGLPTPGAETAYALRSRGIAELVRLEDGLAVLWRDLVASTDDRDLRTLAVRGLSDCAVRATRWRQATRVSPVTQALPGTL